MLTETIMSTRNASGSLFPESQKLAKGGKSAIKRHGAGVFTAEGNVAGSRAGRLAANREKERQLYMKQREELKAKHAKKSVTDINKNFNRTTNENERKFKVRIVLCCFRATTLFCIASHGSVCWMESVVCLGCVHMCSAVCTNDVRVAPSHRPPLWVW